MTRPTRDQTFQMLAEVFAMRGTCPRAKVGAVIVQGGHVIAHGYNGAPSGMPHCLEVLDDISVPDGVSVDFRVGCSDSRDQGCTNAVHAEENAIAYAARVGVECGGATLYCTHEPCLRCSRLIIQSGITRVVYSTPYRDHSGRELLERAGVQWQWQFMDAGDILDRA